MTRLVLILTLAAATFAASSTAAMAATAPGKLKASGSARGIVAIASAQATVNHPGVLYGRATGKVDSVTYIVSCSRGFNVAARTLERTSAGTWKLPMMARPDMCQVTGSAGGSGAIRVEIRST